MIAIYYRWRLVEGREADFVDAWTQITEHLKRQGSLGSALFKSDDGSVVAIARWPDVETRRASSARLAAPELYSRMTNAIAEEFEERILDERVNLWTL
ncbi:MAG: antibiotic biosynthesis monooxygenase [Sphingopyxis sp.]|jgi:hypothetical protein|nr:antibiotic biosynthesis monooxygenase [Sphingopyxis sp.]